MWNFKDTLWNAAQNILPIHWKMMILYNVEHLRDLRFKSSLAFLTLQWRHNERDGDSKHQPHECLLKRLFGQRSKKISKLRVTGLCEGNSPVTGEFPFDDIIMICERSAQGELAMKLKHFSHYWPLVTGDFHSQRTISAEILCLLWSLFGHTVDMPVIRDAVTLIWRHSDEHC